MSDLKCPHGNNICVASPPNRYSSGNMYVYCWDCARTGKYCSTGERCAWPAESEAEIRACADAAGQSAANAAAWRR